MLCGVAHAAPVVRRTNCEAITVGEILNRRFWHMRELVIDLPQTWHRDRLRAAGFWNAQKIGLACRNLFDASANLFRHSESATGDAVKNDVDLGNVPTPRERKHGFLPNT